MTVILKCFVALAAAGSMTACATLTRGTTQQFVVETSPPGAAIKTSNGYTCPSTPCTFSMQRKDAFTVVATKEGFVTQSAEVKSGIAGSGAAGMAGNILIGGLIGIGVDATSGALNDLTPNPLQLVLQPVDAKPPSESGAAPATAMAPAKDPVS